MRATFEPATVVPGARREYELNAFGLPDMLKPKTDSRGRPVWTLPNPIRVAIHFKTEGMRRRFYAAKEKIEAEVADGGITKEQGNELMSNALRATTNQIPVYRGYPASLASKYRHAHLREQRRMGLVDKVMNALK